VFAARFYFKKCLRTVGSEWRIHSKNRACTLTLNQHCQPTLRGIAKIIGVHQSIVSHSLIIRQIKSTELFTPIRKGIWRR